MSSHARNGKLNGGTGAIPDGIADRNKERGTLRMLDQALARGWITPMELPKKLGAELPEIMLWSMNAAKDRGDLRSLHRAVEILLRMANHNTDLAKIVDEAGRLESGEATQRVEYTLRFVD